MEKVQAVNIFEIFPDQQLARDMLKGGYIRRQVNASNTLAIYNYTEKAVFDSVWNHVTLTSRGLIFDIASGQIKARPFKKFFNYNQIQAHPILLDERVTVMDKLDGSLGIWYRDEHGVPAIATRGSFLSDQAKMASRMLTLTYGGWAPSNDEWTPLFEIIYPENRIVIDYGGSRKLVLLGAVHKATGIELHANQAAATLGWPYGVAEMWPGMTYAEVLGEPTLTQREGKEGLVIMDMHGHKLKFKQEDYMTMHKLVTGLSKRAVWEMVDTDYNGAWVESGTDKIMHLPDEFQPWALGVLKELLQQWDDISFNAHLDFHANFNYGMSRKDFALAIKDAPDRAYLFKIYDWQEGEVGKDPLLDMDKMIWQSLKPVGDTRVWNGKEE